MGVVVAVYSSSPKSLSSFFFLLAVAVVVVVVVVAAAAAVVVVVVDVVAVVVICISVPELILRWIGPVIQCKRYLRIPLHSLPIKRQMFYKRAVCIVRHPGDLKFVWTASLKPMKNGYQ